MNGSVGIAKTNVVGESWAPSRLCILCFNEPGDTFYILYVLLVYITISTVKGGMPGFFSASMSDVLLVIYLLSTSYFGWKIVSITVIRSVFRTPYGRHHHQFICVRIHLCLRVVVAAVAVAAVDYLCLQYMFVGGHQTIERPTIGVFVIGGGVTRVLFLLSNVIPYAVGWIDSINIYYYRNGLQWWKSSDIIIKIRQQKDHRTETQN